MKRASRFIGTNENHYMGEFHRNELANSVEMRKHSIEYRLNVH
jgi:hypothetical protein